MGKRNKESRVRHIKRDQSWEPDYSEFDFKPKNENQSKFLEAIHKFDVTFGLGVAGTGKTIIAVHAALEYLSKEKVKRIILTRPVVEAGERLGYLPGTYQEKLDPYLQPLYNSIYDLIGQEALERFRSTDAIKIIPLAYMRGSTFKDSIIILDEGQNATLSQLKMILTRLGYGSKLIVTGDLSQSDLPHKQSGLYKVKEILQNVDTVGFVEFSSKDTVRHPTVAAIVNAFDTYENKDKTLNNGEVKDKPLFDPDLRLSEPEKWWPF